MPSSQINFKDDIADLETIIGYLYRLCIEPICGELIHPQVD